MLPFFVRHKIEPVSPSHYRALVITYLLKDCCQSDTPAQATGAPLPLNGTRGTVLCERG